MKLYRISKRRWATTAFTGHGAAVAGGRWNSPGVPVVYASTTLDLCVLELLVHVDLSLVPPDLVWFEVDVPDDAILELDAPDGWIDLSSPSAVEAGDAWRRARSSVATLVPSALVPISDNALINPRHGRFGELVISEPRDLELDRRLPRRSSDPPT